MAKTGISAPWFTFFHKLEALFGRDPDVKLDMKAVDDGHKITIKVGSVKKAAAISKLLPAVQNFGGVKVHVEVNGPADKLDNLGQIYMDAFEGNPVVEKVTTIETPMIPKHTYVEFANEVVQFYNDELSDPRGNASMLYQDIAKEFLTCSSDLSFCTALPSSAANAVNTEKKPADKLKNTVTKSNKDPLSFKKEIDDLFKTLGL